MQTAPPPLFALFVLNVTAPLVSFETISTSLFAKIAPPLPVVATLDTNWPPFTTKPEAWLSTKIAPPLLFAVFDTKFAYVTVNLPLDI